VFVAEVDQHDDDPYHTRERRPIRCRRPHGAHWRSERELLGRNDDPVIQPGALWFADSDEWQRLARGPNARELRLDALFQLWARCDGASVAVVGRSRGRVNAVEFVQPLRSHAHETLRSVL